MIPNDKLYHLFLHSRLYPFLACSFRSLNPGQELSGAHYVRGLCHALERVARGETRRLIVELPPRHLKSVVASIVLPAWILGRDPSKRIVCVSYSNDLAQSFSHKCRALMQEPFYKACFPALQLDPKKNTVTEFQTTKKGFRLSTSMQGTLTGKGGDIVILDDPMKAQDTHSQATRDAVFETYQSTIATRLDDPKTGAIVVVAQRLHEDDLLGRLKRTGNWEVLSLPAIALEEQTYALGDGMQYTRLPGDTLDPIRMGREELDSIRAEIGKLAFEAEYQQRPVLPGGNLIKLEWFGVYEKPFERAAYEAVIQSWDTAAVPGESNDFTVCTTWGVIGNKIDLLDVYRDKLLYPEIVAAALKLRSIWKPDLIAIEKAVTGMALKPDLNRKGVAEAYWVHPEKGKLERMIAQSAKIEAGEVRLPKAASWLEAFKAEVGAFPNRIRASRSASSSRGTARYCRELRASPITRQVRRSDVASFWRV